MEITLRGTGLKGVQEKLRRLNERDPHLQEKEVTMYIYEKALYDLAEETTIETKTLATAVKEAYLIGVTDKFYEVNTTIVLTGGNAHEI